MLYHLLKQNFLDITFILCEIKYNDQLYIKYNITREECIEYMGDPTLLYKYYDYYKPILVYLNSCNWAICKIHKYIPDNIKLLHTHEVFNHYLLAKEQLPYYVVSNRIADEYFDFYGKKPLVQPPFLTDIDNIVNLSLEIVEIIKNYKGFVFDRNKITIGMCGQINDRKNYKLFIEMSKVFPYYNFFWIGDTIDIFNDYDNIFHIKSTHNPYKYYSQVIDYFILFSLIDPCPYVILENILLDSNIITFSKNIFYNHKCELLKEMYFEYQGTINRDNCVDAINQFVVGKKEIKNDKKGYEYIKQNFTTPTLILEKIARL
jgi:hypothetical protein